jgi:hypothetical protein
MANKHRSEVDLPLAARRLTLRLSLHALAEIEDAFGGGLADATRAIAERGLTATALVRLIGILARAGGARDDDRALAALITAEDLPAIGSALAELFGGLSTARP